MRFCSLIATALLSVLPFQASANGGMSSESLTARGLSTEERTGDFPVCFNGAGELLPCASNVEPPPPTSFVGLWSGRMIYDRDYGGTDSCYDADILISVDANSSNVWVDAITVDRDGGSTSSDGEYAPIINNYVTSEFYVFGIYVEYTLRFNDYGHADGSWTEYANGDCYGTWSILKE